MGIFGHFFANFGKKGQTLAISEFSWHQPYVFPEEDHKFSFYSEKYENLKQRLGEICQHGPTFLVYGQIMVVFGQKRSNFEFSSKNENRQILSFLDVQLHARKQNNLQRRFGCRTRKNALTRVNLQVPFGSLQDFRGIKKNPPGVNHETSRDQGENHTTRPLVHMTLQKQ